jgi:hypothetical protein
MKPDPIDELDSALRQAPKIAEYTIKVGAGLRCYRVQCDMPDNNLSEEEAKKALMGAVAAASVRNNSIAENFSFAKVGDLWRLEYDELCAVGRKIPGYKQFDDSIVK